MCARRRYTLNMIWVKVSRAGFLSIQQGRRVKHILGIGDRLILPYRVEKT